MKLLDLLKSNKGTVSSTLGKELASKILEGELSILSEAIEYVSYDLENVKSKAIRAGAAKIVEKVAEKKPELVVEYLGKLNSGLNAKEPQTRWMLMRVYGHCALLNPDESISVLDFGKNYLEEKAGVCLSGSVYIYLGQIGTISKKTANTVLTILDDSLKTAPENEVDWILEGFYSIIDNLNDEQKVLVEKNAKLFMDAPKKSTQKRVQKILKKIGK